MEDKILKKEIVIEDLEEAYKILKKAGEGLPGDKNIHSKELQSIKNAIKFLEEKWQIKN